MTVFLGTDDFAVTFTYTAAGFPHESNVTATYNGIYDNRYIETEGIQGERPTLLINESDISSPDQDAQITTNGVLYTLEDWQKSGNGLLLLILSENDT